MAYRYISEVMDGTRMRLRTLLGSVRKTEYRRKALAPGMDGRPRWEFPTVCMMGNHVGYWKSIALPKMDGAPQIYLGRCSSFADETAARRWRPATSPIREG